MNAKPELKKGMTKRERESLRAIVRQRFKILEQSVKQREVEASIIIRDRLTAEVADTAQKYDAAVRELTQKVSTLQNESQLLVHRAAADGISISRYDGDNPFRVSLSFTSAAPKNLENRVRAELRLLKKERGMGSLHLEMLQSQLLEELLIGDLESETAKDFLASRIPSAESLVPLPPGTPELESA